MILLVRFATDTPRDCVTKTVVQRSKRGCMGFKSDCDSMNPGLEVHNVQEEEEEEKKE